MARRTLGISTGRHGECARLLLEAGAQVDEALLPTGHDAVDRVLREHFVGAWVDHGGQARPVNNLCPGSTTMIWW